MVNRNDRFEWIERYIRSHPMRAVTTLDTELEDQYGVLVKEPLPLRQLRKDLAEMTRLGRLRRSVLRMGPRESGYPNWIYAYELKEPHEVQKEQEDCWFTRADRPV